MPYSLSSTATSAASVLTVLPSSSSVPTEMISAFKVYPYPFDAFQRLGHEALYVHGCLRRGDVCFCDGFSVHAYEDAKDLTAYVLLFDKTCFAGFASRYPDKTFPAFFTFDDFSLLDTLYRHYLSAPDKSLALTGVCTILTAEFLKQVSPVPRIAGNGDALICRILDHIERRSEERITLASLSELCGYSREHISRTFSKYVGSLPQYVNRIRAQKAKALLAQGDKTVSETAFACGFESLNTFYRAYRAAFGISPKKTKKTP